MAKLNIISAFLILAFTSLVQAQKDGPLNTQQRWEKYGYQYEEYQITTEDGYINTLMRIPSRSAEESTGDRPPVYFNHPSPFSSESFLTLGADSQPFTLVDQGYDVWLNNFRGSVHSRRHVTLDSATDSEYWQYDLVDLRYDLMADITFILDTTGYDRVSTYSFSMAGTALGYAMAIEPEFFSSWIGVAGLLSTPMSYVHTNSLLYSFAPQQSLTLNIQNNLGMNINSGENQFQDIMMKAMSNFPYLLSLFGMFVGGGGYDPFSDDMNGIANLSGFGSSGESNRVRQHFLQSVVTGRVSYYDFGPEGNLAEYGTEEAPLIPFENTASNVALLYAIQDISENPVDNDWYADIIGENLVFYEYYDISHTAFLIGGDREYLVDLENLYEQYSGTRSETS